MTSLPAIVPGLVSTIIPVYNRPQMIVESVESVLAQTYRPIEVIIVDDGSTDDTLKVIEALAAQHTEITVISQANAGPGAARENGRLIAQGEFIQYHDSDDLLLPTKFSQQVAALQTNPNADVAYGKTDFVKIGEQRPSQALKLTGQAHKTMFPAMLRQRWWSTSTPLHRRNVTDQVGAWLPTTNEEDWEYDCRVASLGGRLVYVDDFVSVTRAHDNHICAVGNLDTQHLKHRCLARKKIYQSAINYSQLATATSAISKDDWLFFSKSLFLFARQCVAAGLKTESRTMTLLSMRAIRRPAFAQILFLISLTVLGCKNTSRLLTRIGK